MIQMIKMIIIIIIINCIWLHYYTLTVSKSGEQICRIQLRFMGGDCLFWGLPRWLSGEESARSARDTRDLGSMPGSGRSLGEGNGNPLQYSCLGNPMDRGAWQATVHRVAKSWIQLRDRTFSML